MKIGYLTFGRDDFAYGLALCLSKLSGHEIYRITPKTAMYVDVILFSCFWWEHTYLIADFMRKAGIKKNKHPRPRIIVGGFNTFNPVPFLAYCDAVVVGDGESVISKAIEGDYSHPSILTCDKGSVKWNSENELQAFLHESGNISRIEVARGCRFNCRFCAVKHLKPYREASLSDIRNAIVKSSSKRISLFAPEPSMHSENDAINAVCSIYGKTRQDSDSHISRLPGHVDSVPRVGIEGLSYRLRKSVNKPIKNESIIEAVRESIASGRKGLFMYLILDLPGECKDDWVEFGNTLKAIGELPGASNFLIKPSPSVFLPTPHTPMEFDEIHWDRDYGSIWRDFFGRGAGRNWEVLMAERSRVFSPAMRLLSMISTRSGLEFSEIENEITASRGMRISAGRPCVLSLPRLLKIIDRHGGVERYCGKRSDGPWQIVSISHDHYHGPASGQLPPQRHS